MTADKKKAQLDVYRQMFTYNVTNLLILQGLDPAQCPPYLQETVDYLHHQAAMLAKKAKLTEDAQKSIVDDIAAQFAAK